VSRSIVQTAVTNKDLRLELTYYSLSASWEGHASSQEPATGTGMALQYDDPQVWAEFDCLLEVI
jgi:hypothetical protein